MVSRKRLIIAETFFQDEVILDIDIKKNTSMTILEVLNANKVSINQSCGGYGTCGTCRFKIVKGEAALNEKSEHEKEISRELQLQDHERLSCQSHLNFSEAQVLEIQIVNKPLESDSNEYEF